MKISSLAWNRYYHPPRHFADESRVNVCYSPGKTAVTRKPAGKQGFAQTFLIVLARWIQPRPKLVPLAVCTVCCVPFLIVWRRGGKKKLLLRMFVGSRTNKWANIAYKGSNWTSKVVWNVIEIALYRRKLCTRRKGIRLDSTREICIKFIYIREKIEFSESPFEFV